MEREDLIELNGIIEHIVFRNEENGYTVCDVDTGKTLETFVGIFNEANEGMKINCLGKWTNNANFGKQFSVEYCESSLPETEQAIIKYLASGAIKGVGKATAKLIVDKFGLSTFSVIENEPDKLALIKGITAKKAEDISKYFKEQYGVREVFMFLNAFSISASSAVAVWKKWGASSVDKIKENPYILVNEIRGIDFAKADEIAESLGFDGSYPKRIQSGILYILKHNLSNGHTYLPLSKITAVAYNLLDCGDDDIDDAVYELENDELIVCIESNDDSFIYLKEYYDAEAYIANRLYNFSQYKAEKQPVDGLVKEIQSELNIKYAENQINAIKSAAENRIMILTGGPGTGKTTTLNGIINLFKKQNKTVLLAAPTGRAAKRMNEVTSQEAKTIHRLLGIDFDSARNEYIFTYNRNNPLKCDAVIIDEFSMVDTLLFESLLEAVPSSSKLILVGDMNQLPSVGAGNLFLDIISSGRLPAIKLDKIFRQSMQSLIVTNAHAILHGELPNLNTTDSDFFFMKRLEPNGLCKTVDELVLKRLPAYYNFDPITDIQVLCPTKKTLCGTQNLNIRLQQILNPPSEEKSEYKHKGGILRENDKVMQIKNNYSIMYQRDDGSEDTGIFNGDMGVIEKIDYFSKKMQIRFYDKVAVYDFEALDEIELAYAVTVHKSQGSEFNAVIIPILQGPSLLFYRNLLYTAITRAKKLVVIVGNEMVVKKMVENNKIDRRYTGLRQMLDFYFENSDSKA